MKQEDIYGDIVKNAFAKAEHKFLNNKKYKLAETISEKVEEISKLRVTRETFVNYYNKYVENREGIATPKHENIELLCRYLGYESYEVFLQKDLYAAKNKFNSILRTNILLLIMCAMALTSIGWVSHSVISSGEYSENRIWQQKKLDSSGQQLVQFTQPTSYTEIKNVFALNQDNTIITHQDISVIWYFENEKAYPVLNWKNDKRPKKYSFYTDNTCINRKYISQVNSINSTYNALYFLLAYPIILEKS